MAPIPIRTSALLRASSDRRVPLLPPHRASSPHHWLQLKGILRRGRVRRRGLPQIGTRLKARAESSLALSLRASGGDWVFASLMGCSDVMRQAQMRLARRRV